MCHSVLFETLHVLWLLAQVLASLAAVLLLCVFLKSFVIGPFSKKLHAESKGNKEILVLGMAAFIFFMLTVCTLVLFIFFILFSSFLETCCFLYMYLLLLLPCSY